MVPSTTELHTDDQKRGAIVDAFKVSVHARVQNVWGCVALTSLHVLSYSTPGSLMVKHLPPALLLAASANAPTLVERDAFGSDEYHPISRTGTNLSSSSDKPGPGIGYNIIDTLDTLLLFAQSDSTNTLLPAYNRARKWLEEKHTWDVNVEYNTFEVTIKACHGTERSRTAASKYRAVP